MFFQNVRIGGYLDFLMDPKITILSQDNFYGIIGLFIGMELSIKKDTTV